MARDDTIYETFGNLALKPGYYDDDRFETLWRPGKPELRLVPKNEDHEYTFDEFIKLDLPGDNRYELRGGKIYMMATPVVRHVVIVQNVYHQIHDYLEGKPCRAYIAGLGVRPRPRKDRKDKEYLVPDIVVLCNKEKLTKDVCEGAPDMVVEVLSPSTANVDRDEKRHMYEDAGVREYWIVAPNEQTVETFVLGKDGKFMQDCYSLTEEHPNRVAPVYIFPGLTLKLADIFAE
jgi:Uma2 family endonuclease